MVQIIYLAPGKQPEPAERLIVIERCAPGGQITVSNTRSGIIIKVPAPSFRAEINAFCRMADEAGIAKLYVKGAPVTSGGAGETSMISGQAHPCRDRAG
jgi:hypothetical protein